MSTTTEPLTPRQRLVVSARALIQERGVHGVGLREVVTHAGAPRGSLQHYFPGGKSQLVAEALAQSDSVARRALRRALAEDGTPVSLVHDVVGSWREELLRDDFRRGCPYTATVIDTSAGDEALRAAASEHLRAWHADLVVLLQRSGLDGARARSVATLAQSAVQGALVLARAHHDVQPLDDVEEELVALLEAVTAPRATPGRGSRPPS